ncbi:MAG: hypothetical protein OWR52_01535, partial [Acidibacillus sp.]|nr:hypothetical protein [Acidibacillus sp.]
MYSSFSNQLYHLFHYILAFAILFLWLPKYLFIAVDGDHRDQLIANMMRMVFFSMITTYLLLVIHLYEVMSFLGVIILWNYLRNFRLSKDVVRTPGVFIALLYDLIDSPQIITNYLSELRPTIHHLRMKKTPPSWLQNFQLYSVWLTFIIVIYIHFYAAVTVAAPPLSDSYVDLAWIQYINQRILFHDGIYPQGFYIFMDLLFKFSFINTLYVVKYTGGLDAILLMYGLYFIITSWTHRRLGALIAVIIYGILGHALLLDDYVRLATSESQEFGVVFVLPSIYFLHRYISRKQDVDLWTAFAGMCITGLVNPVSYLFEAVGCIAVAFAFIILDYRATKKELFKTLFAGVASIVVTLAPLGTGLLLGHPINQASTTFIDMGVHHITFPQLSIWDAVTLCSLVILLFTLISTRRNERSTPILSVALLGIFIFLIYYFGASVSKSEVIAVRAIDLWAYTEALVIGMTIQTIFSLLGEQSKLNIRIETGIMFLLIIVIPIVYPIRPILPYRMQWNQSVEEYLSINQHYKYVGYMIVSEDYQDYDLVLGDGYFMPMKQFLHMYNPTAPTLTQYGSTRVDRNISPHVFLFYPTNIIKVNHNNANYPLLKGTYTQETNQRIQLKRWLALYRSTHK